MLMFRSSVLLRALCGKMPRLSDKSDEFEFEFLLDFWRVPEFLLEDGLVVFLVFLPWDFAIFDVLPEHQDVLFVVFVGSP